MSRHLPKGSENESCGYQVKNVFSRLTLENPGRERAYMRRVAGVSVPSGTLEWESSGQVRELSGRWLSQVGLQYSSARNLASYPE